MKRFIASCAMCFLVVPQPAHAGDPCPIPVTIHDLGAPDWLDRNGLLNGLQSRQKWLGIQYSDVEMGLGLTHVHHASPAADAGLIPDDIILSINGISMADMTAREALFDEMNAGDEVPFAVLRGENHLAIKVVVGGIDPVPYQIVQALGDVDCRDVSLRTPPENERREAMAKLFTQNRGFRCEDAHIALQGRGEKYTVQDVYFVRGSRRLLLSMPYWGTTCVSVSSLDGDNLTDTNAVDVINRVISGYVQDRHANP